MDSDLKYAIIGLCVVLGISGLAVCYSLLNPSPSRIEAFVGRLDSIEYEQQSWQSSVSATILHFQNGIDFKQGGYHQYSLGYEYEVIYKITGYSNNLLTTVLSVERYD